MNKYERKRMYEEKASLTAGYLVEAFRDYVVYVNPQLEKFPQSMREYASQIRACQWELLGLFLEAVHCDGGRRRDILASALVRLKVILALLRMSAGDLGVACLSSGVYERVAGMLVGLEDLVKRQMEAIAG